MVLRSRNSTTPARSTQRCDPDPSGVETIARLAAMHAGRGETLKALNLYQLALLTDESRPEIWYSYGSLQRRLHMHADAVESFEFALRQDPALYAARYSLARVLCDLGHPLEALSQFRLVTQQRPSYVPAWRYLVQLTWAVGNPQEAQRLAREALTHAPGDGELEGLLQRVVQGDDETIDAA
jgi:tetratricopeptide (TPR) repeat protein